MPPFLCLVFRAKGSSVIPQDAGPAASEPWLPGLYSSKFIGWGDAFPIPWGHPWGTLWALPVPPTPRRSNDRSKSLGRNWQNHSTLLGWGVHLLAGQYVCPVVLGQTHRQEVEAWVPEPRQRQEICPTRGKQARSLIMCSSPVREASLPASSCLPTSSELGAGGTCPAAFTIKEEFIFFPGRELIDPTCRN